nr:MAG TPA: hypothetical protein [Caudoviricetes sp.]
MQFWSIPMIKIRRGRRNIRITTRDGVMLAIIFVPGWRMCPPLVLRR